jgi:hypothetical protein
VIQVQVRNIIKIELFFYNNIYILLYIMKNLIVCIILIILLVVLFWPSTEKFSSSGLAVSDKYCVKLADVYYRPQDRNPMCRKEYPSRLCAKPGKFIIDDQTGNYYTSNNVLI